MAALARELRIKNDLEQQIAQLVAQFVPGLALYRIGYLVGLLDGVRRDGREILLEVPGAAALRVAQLAHNFQ